MGFAHRLFVVLALHAHHPLVLKPRRDASCSELNPFSIPRTDLSWPDSISRLNSWINSGISAMVRRRSARRRFDWGQGIHRASAALEVAVHGRRLCGPTTCGQSPLLAHTDVVPSLIHAATESHVLPWTIEGIQHTGHGDQCAFRPRMVRPS